MIEFLGGMFLGKMFLGGGSSEEVIGDPCPKCGGNRPYTNNSYISMGDVYSGIKRAKINCALCAGTGRINICNHQKQLTDTKQN